MTEDPLLPLAAQLHQQGRGQEAFSLYRQILARAPGESRAWAGLGLLLHQHGAHADAMEHFARAVAIDPSPHSVWSNYGEAARSLGKLAFAEQCYRKAISLSETHPMSHNNLGVVLHAQGRHEDAEKHLRRSLELNPGATNTSAWANLANVLRDQMRFEEAEASLRHALSLRPDSPTMRSNLLFLLGYRGGCSPADVYAESRAWQRQHPFQSATSSPSPTPHAQRRLRVGFVSPDFRRHSIANFIEPLLSSVDRTGVETFGYASVARPDEMTERLRKLTSEWHSIYTLDDDQAAALIRSHQLDVLIDLAGHTSGNRLGVFLRCPAPVQACWMGYFATTGLSVMDYWITDGILHPEMHDDIFSERLWRLPACWLAYQAPAHAPEPSAKNEAGTICFGSFNQILKVTDDTVALWSALLRQVPRSRLLLKTKSLADTVARDRVWERFRAAGITADRIELLPWVPSSTAHLGLYERVNIALDTTPFSGGTTSCEALWMGVPVLTLQGATMPARMSSSLLHAAGCGSWVARSSEQFVTVGVAEAARVVQRSTDERVQKRKALRARLAASRLMDRATFARDFEHALRGMLDEKFA